VGLVLSITLSILGVGRYLAGSGLNVGSLVVFSVVVGFAGSFISLLMSKTMAKWTTGARVIDAPATADEQWLVATVGHLAEKSGLAMPEVAIYEGAANAFATGAFRDSALVAVSSGLLESMTREEVEAVLGHEISHVANGDMVTLTLIQGVLNTLVIVLARIVGRVVDSWMSGGRERDGEGGIGYFVVVMVLQIVFGLFASMIVAAFSRWREFRADAAGARFAGRGAMISALQRLKVNHGESTLPNTIAAFGISGPLAEGFKKLFMSHPPLDERIAALQNAA
jgi:heat shock protein HtpX